MTHPVKEFIQDNKDLIEENKWDQLYDNAIFNLDSESTGELGKIFLDLGIDPIAELDYIPGYYLSSTDITSFTIPNHIHLLSNGCFSYCLGLDEIVIPESVTEIAQFAFYACNNLKKITILSDNLINLAISSFDMTHPDAVIICKKGTLADHYAQENNFKVQYI